MWPPRSIESPLALHGEAMTQTSNHETEKTPTAQGADEAPQQREPSKATLRRPRGGMSTRSGVKAGYFKGVDGIS